MSGARFNLIWLIIFTVTLPLSVVAATNLARKSFEKVQLRGQTITVKGYAEKPITSDRAEWSAKVVVRNADRTAAYRALQQHRQQVIAYLGQRGFPADAIALGPVAIDEVHELDSRGNRTNTIESYCLSQRLSIASSDVDKVGSVARDAAELIAQGIDLQSDAPSYLYTKLDELKLAMLTEATANARQRAELMATGSGNQLGALKSASQGVFQITPAFSTEVSDYGYSDTSSLKKVIKAVVTVEFGIAG